MKTSLVRGTIRFGRAVVVIGPAPGGHDVSSVFKFVYSR
jgi:hypothetical protein